MSANHPWNTLRISRTFSKTRRSEMNEKDIVNKVKDEAGAAFKAAKNAEDAAKKHLKHVNFQYVLFAVAIAGIAYLILA